MNFIYKSSTEAAEFAQFKLAFPEWENDFAVCHRDSDTYKRIHCIYTKTVSGDDKTKLKNDYFATINVKTGDIYLDCRRRKIFAKHFLLMFLRPLYTMAKTAWHASIIFPIALEVFNTLKGEQSPKEGLRNFGVSMIDIALTPICGFAMTLVSIGSVAISIFFPNVVYYGRDVVGYLERVMHHVEHRADALINAKKRCLSPCFSPLANLSTIHSEWAPKRDSNPQQTAKSIRVGQGYYASCIIRSRQKNRAVFNDCWMLHPATTAYVSAALEKNGGKKG